MARMKNITHFVTFSSFFFYLTMIKTQALLSLLSAADPSAKASSYILSSWNPLSPTPCTWQGITCSPQNRVISLSLPDTFLNLSSQPPQLFSLSSLQLLNLSSINVSGIIPPTFGKFTYLRLLDLSSNSLIGPIPPELGTLSSLQFLFLNNNKLSSRIPQQLANLTSLEVLCLQDNLLNGSIPSQLGSLVSLQQVIPAQLGLLINLTTFSATATGLLGVIPPTFGNLINLQTSIPPELGLCSEVRNLYVHMNKLTGPIPPQLSKLQKLTSLLLRGNALSGPIPAELSNCSSLVVFDAFANDICGEIPSDLGKLVVLEQLHLSDNELTGKILWHFFLWGNSVTGTIPSSFGNCTELYALDLLRNKLTGSIPEEIFGGLPRSVANCRSLVRLRLGENQLLGKIPKEIGQLQNLVFLDLYMNHFSGGLPYGIANITVLELLDMHNNYITREIPSQLGELVNLELLDLSRNSFTGGIPWTFGNFSYLNNLILNNNLLTGSIPTSIRNLQKLTLLNLSYNSLFDSIPPEICYVKSLTIREIPETMAILSSLTSLTSLNISYNNFSGPIPLTPLFRTLSLNSYLQNLNLCDLVRRNGLKSSKTIALILVVLASVTILVLASLIPLICNPKFLLSMNPFQKPNFSIDNILDCLKDENVIGKGCSGVVYKAEMPIGERIAVKKLWKTKIDEEPMDSFTAEIQILGHIRHRNIVKLLGYCSNKSGNRNLDWETRYKIAVGSAQGLAYLYHDCVPAILNRDVKCNNILLDSKFEANLTDFGLAKLMNSPNYNHAMSRVAGSYGFSPVAEYGYTINITEKSDVYSYGVVLLEILSGRSAVEPHVGDGVHIVEWPAVSVLDAKLQGLADQIVQEMLQTLGIAMFCVNSSLVQRPTMKEVVSPPEEWGKTSQPLIKQSSNQS
ncbi:hypothetical protein I3760_16G007600 [Carya illinoinensis]|nr:hypothetical protein I3760_16G007600 [Carya illinoinensis]